MYSIIAVVTELTRARVDVGLSVGISVTKLSVPSNKVRVVVVFTKQRFW